MKSKRARLDRYISQRLSMNRKDIRLLVAQKRIYLDGEAAVSVQQFVDEYTRVEFDGQLLQAKTAIYLQLNKPSGVVSATKDAEHRTVIDLLPERYLDHLHIVGRLDLNSTGLLLLTNDGRWSRKLTEPEAKVKKRYLVTLDKPVNPEVVEAFSAGMYFSYEDITTRPALLRVIDPYTAEVVLEEGRYHQIKRMFGRFQIKVMTLHRLSVGNLVLDDSLAGGESRLLTDQEIRNIFPNHDNEQVIDNNSILPT